MLKKETKSSFSLWKKTVRFVIFVETLRRHTSEALTLKYTRYALYFWQRYTANQRLKGLRTDHIRTRWTALTKQEWFKEWFNRAKPLIAANVIERKTRLSRVMKQKRRIFKNWSQWAGRKSVLGELGKVLGKHTTILLLSRIMKQWNRAALYCSIVRTFCIKHDRTLIKKALYALYQNLNKKVAKSQEIASLRSALQLQQKMGSFISKLPSSADKAVYNKHWAIMVLLKTFKSIIDTDSSQLKIYTLKKWRGMVSLLRYRRMQRDQATQMTHRSLRLKYWVRMRKEFIERKKEAILLFTVRNELNYQAQKARVKLVQSKVWQAWCHVQKIGKELGRMERVRSLKIKKQTLERLKFFKKRAMHINSLR